MSINNVKILLFLTVIFFVLYAAGCRKKENKTFTFMLNGNKTAVSLLEIEKDVFDIKAETLINGEAVVSTWRLDYPVFRFDCADITGDGVPEIAAGVIKSTRFDAAVKKRLFLFKLYDSLYVRPLWLGSKMPLPLEDFKLADGKIRTIERESENTFVVAEYGYNAFAFGPKFEKYIKKGASKKEARSLMNL